jgi:drug/metabolite transporter (DMT)-like permease
VMVITGVCMGIGAIALAVGSAAWRWIPLMSLQTWGIVIILAATNTALAFTMWNLSLQKLTAFEANIINNTMLVQIAILSWIFLGDVITLKMAIGMFLVMGGAVLVNFNNS